MKFKKNFKEDIEILNQKLINKENFSFSKYADGEHQILLNNPIINCDNWFFDPTSNDEFYKMLTDSLKFKDDGYYIGISCPCCDLLGYRWYMDEKGSDETHTTFANLFVNSNNSINVISDLFNFVFKNFINIIIILDPLSIPKSPNKLSIVGSGINFLKLKLITKSLISHVL